MLMVCAFFCLFISAAGGQTAGPILTSNVSKRVFLEILHSFGGKNNNITISGGQSSKKPLKIGPNRHFPAKMPQYYNGNISETVSPIKLKFEAQLGTTRYQFKNTKLGHKGALPGSRDQLLNFGTPNISGMAEGTNFKFYMQFDVSKK